MHEPHRWLASTFLLVLLLIGSVSAQETPVDSRRAELTRAELQSLVASGRLSSDDQAVIKRRLEQGDLEAGDKIALRVVDEPTLTDTFTVQPGRTIRLPNIPEISLAGVLRSETEMYLKDKIARYIRDPQVRATALTRIAVLGAVGRPGFYTLPASMLVSEAIMSAGGPTQSADIRKTTIRRGEVKVASGRDVHAAIGQGASLDELNLHAGDELVVGEKSGGVRGTFQTIGLLSGVLFAVVAISRIFR